jgi:hypothetical protein
MGPTSTCRFADVNVNEGVNVDVRPSAVPTHQTSTSTIWPADVARYAFGLRTEWLWLGGLDFDLDFDLPLS